MEKQAHPDQVNVQFSGPGQPGMQMQPMQMPMGVVVPQGLPPGLAYLAGLNEVKIHQHFDMLEGEPLVFYIDNKLIDQKITKRDSNFRE